MRISTQQMWNSTLGDITNAQVDQSAAREQISSGRRISKASDDPGAAERSSKLRAGSGAIDQYARAGQDAIAFMNAQDRTIQSVLDRVGRVEELTIAMATDTLTQEAREVAAIEVEEIRTEVIAMMNTQHAGKSLFGGFQDVAVTDGPAGASFTGDTGQIIRRIAKDQTLQVNLETNELLGFDVGRNLFAVLNDIVLDARSQNIGSLGDLRLIEMEALRQSLNNGLGVVGTRTRRVEQTLGDLDTEQVALKSTVANLEDADIVEASIKVSEATLAYEAALAASAQINRVSLLNYL